MQDNTKERPLPGIVDTLKAGFELTTRHPWLLILPLLLDLWLWLGPRLGVQQLLEPALVQIFEQAGSTNNLADQLPQFLARFNLFSMASVPLFGIPTLTSDMLPAAAPLSPAVLPVASWGTFWLITIVLTFCGLVLGALYYALLAQLVLFDRVDLGQFGRQLVGNALRLVLLTLLTLLLIFAVILPIAIIASLFGLFSIAFVPLVLLGGSMVVMWTVIFVSFSLQALLLERGSPLAAIRSSVRFVQRWLNTALPFLLVMVVIGRVTDSLMITADSGNWLTLVSLTGHAFIVTALAAASFIFYRDRVINSQDAVRVTARSAQR